MLPVLQFKMILNLEKQRDGRDCDTWGFCYILSRIIKKVEDRSEFEGQNVTGAIEHLYSAFLSLLVNPGRHLWFKMFPRSAMYVFLSACTYCGHLHTVKITFSFSNPDHCTALVAIYSSD